MVTINENIVVNNRVGIDMLVGMSKSDADKLLEKINEVKVRAEAEDWKVSKFTVEVMKLATNAKEQLLCMYNIGYTHAQLDNV